MTVRNFAGALGLMVACFSVGCSAGADRGHDDDFGEMEESALAANVAAGSAAVTTGNVNLRSAPSMTASISSTLPKGTGVTLVDGQSHSGFYEVELEDGRSGHCFGSYLRLGASSHAPGDEVGDAVGETFHSRGTGYYPDSSLLEGGFVDRRGVKLRTLQQFLTGDASYVSVAMDTRAFAYGQKLRIRELEQKYGRAIEFRVVDTGGAFRGRGRSRIDICTANRTSSLDPVINGSLTLTIAE